MSLQYDKLLLFGDSITEFAFNPEQFSIGTALTNAYTRKLDVVQRGFSGYNSRWGVRILKKLLSSESGNIVMAVVFFGANDACLGGHQRVDVAEYVQNLQAMVRMLQDRRIKPIVVSPGLIDRGTWDASRQEEISAGYVRTNEQFKLYAESLVDWTQRENIPLVNLYKAFSEQKKHKCEDLLADGLHLSGDGYRIYYDELCRVIDEFYPELSASNLPYKLPYWRDVKEDGSNIFE
ncbi:isoamyl acetate-hydrolyzing esterase KNAG_0B04160 [Huiozyma naganishii CBS 8797]|uniref:SGNH hydrolase-type esterase domain-containing protein n=1 Tax=Huiozyma naganishii (strain ATCC MYA-139 / BCRC 22969 / CBS 8797 / KCTC 17520 / NBRC 10181 / NCYC 3082 / Yp74L-3) TaxID=1071383 RepID=J7S4W9_HUIN7|nr:hypothetical protein KNAG_0B04160 [Kazachstania naganishii CBS 8797]CCK68851.1 hypothetical protein KNAG_0B04160 [Kazachstania naganishii CBS 8797]